jgi:uncharacterized protein with GYD domain
VPESFKFYSGSVAAFGGRSLTPTDNEWRCPDLQETRLLVQPRGILLPTENVMKRLTTFTLTTAALLCLGLALPNGDAVGQQQTGSTLHRYLVRADLTPEGIKNLQKQPPTALKAGVAKFVESVGGKLEFWFFDYGESTAYSVIQYPDEVAAATAQLSTNAAGFARVRIRPLLSAEDMDKAVAKMPPVRVPQQQ